MQNPREERYPVHSQLRSSSVAAAAGVPEHAAGTAGAAGTGPTMAQVCRVAGEAGTAPAA